MTTIFEPGQKVGDSIVVARLPNDPYEPRRYLVRCGCGHERPVRGVRVETVRNCSRCLPPYKHVTHGEGKMRTPEYNSWSGMKSRCLDPNGKDFKNYGARGITVCDRWRESYPAFLADMGRKPSPQHSLDRS